jgi:thiamine-phosphate diphosphorylase
MPAPMPADHPRVLLVTDSRRLVPQGTVAARMRAILAQAREAFAAGVDAVQIRESDLDGGALLELACAVAALGPAIVTDRLDVALAANASGVHLRADGVEPCRARVLLRPGMTLSRAVHHADEAGAYGADDALDWLVAGPAFETDSKPGRAPLGVPGLREIARASRLPVLAIGGVTPSNVRDVHAAGAAGVAGIGAFLPPIRRAYVDRLRDALRRPEST